MAVTFLRIQFSRPAAELAEVNPPLAQFKIGIESDTGRVKLGNGGSWNSTPYLTNGPPGPAGPIGDAGPQGPPGIGGEIVHFAAGADFSLPANGHYVIGVVTTATVATSALVQIVANLQIHNA
jgi:hypothetical protein